MNSLRPHGIPVDYDEPNAIISAIVAGKYSDLCLGLQPEQIPLMGSGQAIRKVYEIHLGMMVQNRHLTRELRLRGQAHGLGAGLKCADPLTALKFAVNFPEKQRQYSLATPFNDIHGQGWCLYLSGKGGKRFLSISPSSPDNHWYTEIRFITACEP